MVWEEWNIARRCNSRAENAENSSCSSVQWSKPNFGFVK
ncbi:hypothetical protein A2U01_0018811, partial [Trifolium medium]|nr:hypothetical protein [Trifolium medium]